MTSSTSCNAKAEERVVVYKKGAWSKEEDEKLRRAVEEYGIKNWVKMERLSGLGRPAKNCRLRWLNYLRPNLKKHPFTEEEEKLIIDLHFKHGNAWARIASQVAGRSDNEIKNFWHKRVKKCKREKVPIYPTTKSNMQQKQSHTNSTTNHSNQEPIIPNANANANNPNNTTWSCIIPNHTLNTVNNSHLPPSIPLHLPQTMIPSQFLSSPSTLLLTSTSSSSSQSPTTNHFSQHPTPPSPNTPTSLTISHHLQPPSSSQPPAASSTLFTKPLPILSEKPFFRAASQLSPPSGDHSTSAPASLVVNASPFLSPDSCAQIQWSSPMDSPRSTLKLNLSPQMPPQYSGFQLNSPTTPPLKVHSSFPVPTQSCFQSNLSIPDSTVQLNSSKQLELSQPMTVDTNQTTPSHSSPTVKGEPPSIQSHQPETSGVNICMHEEESDSDLEIMDELREAQARVRFLKKKLRQRRISNKSSLLKVSRNEASLDESSEASDLLRTEVPLDGNSSQSMMKDCALLHTSQQSKDLLGGDRRVDASPENSRENEIPMRNIRKIDDMIGISKPKGEVKKKAKKEYRENLESGEDRQGSRDLETIHSISSESRISSEKSLQREEDLLDHLKIQNSVSDPLRTLQGLAGKYSNDCSSMEGFLSESSSTLLQDSLLKGDLFSQTSHVEHQFSSQSHTPLLDAFGQFCNQNTLVKPGDEGVQLSYLQSDDGLMDGNLAARSILHESNVLMHQNSTSAHLLDSNSMGCEQFSLHNFAGHSSESQPSFVRHQYHAAHLLDSGYLMSKQLTEQESLGGVCFSLQPDGCGSSSDTPNLCESAFLLHQSPESSLIDARYLVGFEHESQSVEQYCHQTWKQYDEPERQTVFQDQIFAMNSLDSIVNPMESMNWNNESTSGYTGVLHQEQEQDHMNTMPEELSSLLDFFPTTVQTLEWCNIGNEIPNAKTSDEIRHDMSLGLQMTSTSQPLITIADYI